MIPTAARVSWKESAVKNSGCSYYAREKLARRNRV
jgi:hypothetical protein